MVRGRMVQENAHLLDGLRKILVLGDLVVTNILRGLLRLNLPIPVPVHLVEKLLQVFIPLALALHSHTGAAQAEN